PFAALSAAVAASHVCRCAGFVDKHQASRIELGLLSAPCLTSHGYVRSILFGCVQAFLKGEIEMIDEPRDRRFANHHLLLPQSCRQSRQLGVRPLRIPLFYPRQTSPDLNCRWHANAAEIGPLN